MNLRELPSDGASRVGPLRLRRQKRSRSRLVAVVLVGLEGQRKLSEEKRAELDGAQGVADAWMDNYHYPNPEEMATKLADDVSGLWMPGTLDHHGHQRALPPFHQHHHHPRHPRRHHRRRHPPPPRLCSSSRRLTPTLHDARRSPRTDISRVRACGQSRGDVPEAAG
jgi:hypothetical protein